MRYIWLLYLYKCRRIDHDGDSFEGKQECITNNDGTISYYNQGVIKCSDGRLIEGSRINSLWNGKEYFKWENGARQISERLNDKRHGPAIFYDYDGKVKIDYYSNGEKIFLL